VTTVGEIMSSGLLSIDRSAPLTEAARRMSERHVGAILVVEGEALRGILTERDVLRAVGAGPVGSASVADWMTPDPETIEASDSTGHAASLMIHGGFRHLPVYDGGRLSGIISIRDLIRLSLDDESPRGV
jgi:CBS domain-containing protein